MNCLLLTLFSGVFAEINISHRSCETVTSYLMSLFQDFQAAVFAYFVSRTVSADFSGVLLTHTNTFCSHNTNFTYFIK
jgi:hypothetical protein